VISKKQQKKEKKKKKKREFARRQNRKTGTTDGVVYYRGHSESESGLRWRERERECVLRFDVGGGWEAAATVCCPFSYLFSVQFPQLTPREKGRKRVCS
jgi:hypothetical protein